MWNSLSNINFYENLLDQKCKAKERITENDVNIAKLCRTCLREAPDTNNLLKEFEIGAMNINLDGKLLKMIDMMEESTGLKVEESDSLPHQICSSCFQNLSGAYFFRMQAHKAERTLMRLLIALSDNAEPPYEDVQHLDETSSDNAIEIALEAEDVDATRCELMEIKFDSVESTELISEAVMACEDIIEKPHETIEELKVEYIEKTDDDDSEEVGSVTNLAVEGDKEVVDEIDETSIEDYKCSECDEHFELKKALHEHIRTAHPAAKAFKCDICDAKLGNVQTLKRHMKIHQTDQKNKLCTFCGKRFARADDLKRHVRTHTNERPYACSKCPKSYKQTSELKEHMDTHSRDKLYSCEICGKCLLTRNGYYVHMKVHAGVKNHKCLVCEKSFVTSGELHSHVRHIHDKERPFACTFENCDRKFATKLSFDIHQRAHTGERPFGCTICGKKLATSSSLSEHVKLHTGAKRFHCSKCNRTFNSASSIKKHLPRHEKGKENEVRTEEESEEASFTCSSCGNCFGSLNDLKEHESYSRCSITSSNSPEKMEDEEPAAEENVAIVVEPASEEQSTDGQKKGDKEDWGYLIEYREADVHVEWEHDPSARS